MTWLCRSLLAVNVENERKSNSKNSARTLVSVRAGWKQAKQRFSKGFCTGGVPTAILHAIEIFKKSKEQTRKKKKLGCIGITLLVSLKILREEVQPAHKAPGPFPSPFSTAKFCRIEWSCWHQVLHPDVGLAGYLISWLCGEQEQDLVKFGY